MESPEAQDLSQKTRLIELVSAISTVCHVIVTKVRFYRNIEKNTDLCVLADYNCVGKFWKRVFLEFIWTFGVYPFYLKNKTVMVLQKMYEMIPSTSASVVERIHWVDDAGVTRPACMGAKTLRDSEVTVMADGKQLDLASNGMHS